MRHIANDWQRCRPRSQWVHYCDSDRFVVTRMWKVDGVRRDGGVNVPCRGGKQDSVQAATPAMCGEILRVGVWRMCQNRVQQGSGPWMLAMMYGVWPGRAILMARAWLPMEGSLETYLDMELWTRNCVSGFSSP